jgi:hypothetical protein
MIEIHFGTPGFGILNFPRLPPPGTLLPRFHDLSMGFLPQISGYEYLRLFGLQKFQNFPPTLSPGVLSLEVNDPSTCVFWNQRSICTLAFRIFRPNATCHMFPHWSVQSLDCMIYHHVAKIWKWTCGPIRQ